VARSNEIQHGTQAKQIGSMINGLATRLLGRHVAWSSRNDSGMCQTRIVHSPSQPEIGDQQSFNAILEQYIGGLNIAMNDALLMSCRQTQCGLDAYSQYSLDAKRPFAVDTRLQGLTSNVLHYKVWILGVRIDVMNSHNMFVNDRCSGAGFAAKALPGSSVSSQMRSQHFYGDRAIQLRVNRFEYNPHTSSTNSPFDLVASYSTEHFRMRGRLQQLLIIVGCSLFIAIRFSARPRLVI
jgi:hypothetical protein